MEKPCVRFRQPLLVLKLSCSTTVAGARSGVDFMIPAQASHYEFVPPGAVKGWMKPGLPGGLSMLLRYARTCSRRTRLLTAFLTARGMDYQGWYALDIFPYREDGVRAATESIRWIKGLHGLLDKIGRDRVDQVIASGDAMEASAMIREALLG